MGIMTNRSSIRTGKLAFLLLTLTVLAAFQPGLAETQLDIEEIRQAAEQGEAKAQYNLGVMYAKGEGVPEDDREAVKWFRLAAEQGDAMAQHNLGVMYDKGEGVPKDDREAVRWYRMAAEQGLDTAQFTLGTRRRHVRQWRGSA